MKATWAGVTAVLMERRKWIQEIAGSNGCRKNVCSEISTTSFKEKQNKLHSFTHSFTKYLLTSYNVPGCGY